MGKYLNKNKFQNTEQKTMALSNLIINFEDSDGKTEKIERGQEIASNLMKCSGYIKKEIEDQIESNPDYYREDKEPHEIGVQKQENFTIEEIHSLLDYLKEVSYINVLYGDIISSSKVEGFFTKPIELELIKKYDNVRIAKLYSCADFFQVESLKKFCLLRVAIDLFIDDNNTIDDIRKKHGIKEIFGPEAETFKKKLAEAIKAHSLTS